MSKETKFNLSEQMEGVDLQVALQQAKKFLKSKSYPNTNDYWKAVKKYCEDKLAGDKLI